MFGIVLLYLFIGDVIVSKKRNDDTIIYGSPKWSFFFSMAFQLICLPMLYLCIQKTRNLNVAQIFNFDYLDLNVESMHMSEFFFIASFQVYLIKDVLLHPMPKLFQLHHIVCFLTSFIVYYYTKLTPVFIFGVLCLEMGSASQSLFFLTQKKYDAVMYLLFMSLTNIETFSMVYEAHCKQNRYHDVPNIVITHFMFSLTFILCFVRQMACLHYLNEYTQKKTVL